MGLRKPRKRASRVNELKERIDYECRRAGITLAELAKRIGKDRQGLYSVVRRGDMKASVLFRIAKALGVPMEILMTPVAAEEVSALQSKIGRQKAKSLKQRRGERSVSFF